MSAGLGTDIKNLKKTNPANGLQLIGNNIGLGGVLTQTTTIDGLFELYVGLITPLTALEFVTSDGVNQARVLFDGNQVEIKAFDGINTSTIVTIATPIGIGDGSINNNLVVIDNISNKGLVGNLDYSVNYSQFSYIQKIYADTVYALKLLTGYTVGANTPITVADSVLVAFGKVQGQINATNVNVATKENTITAGTTLQYWRGDKTFQTLNTLAVPELTNLYFTTARVLATLLTGYTVGANTPITVADSVLVAFGKVQAQINSKPNLINLYEWEFEDFFNSNLGSKIVFTSQVANGGTIDTEIPEQQPDVNNIISKPRFGQASNRVTAVANSRSAIQSQNNFRFFNTALIGVGAEFSIVGGQVNFTNDPLLVAVGFFDGLAVNNPTNGVYIRPPRTSETSTYKLVVRQATVETLVQDTTATYDSTNRRFVSVFLQFDGVANTLIATIKYGNVTIVSTILNFSVTYASIVALNLLFGACNIRNGVGSAMVATNLNVDKFYRYIQNNY